MKIIVERRNQVADERREFNSMVEAIRFIEREGDQNRLWKVKS